MSSTFDWQLHKTGPVFITECGFPIGLASRNLAQDRKLRPRGAAMRAAIYLARERGDKLVRLEYLLVALGEHKLTDGASPLRGTMARTRRKERVAAVEAAREAKREARRQKAAARKAAA